MTEDSAGACVSSMRRELKVIACNFMVFDCYSVERRKRIKTVVWTRINGCLYDDDEQSLLWSVPNCVISS